MRIKADGANYPESGWEADFFINLLRSLIAPVKPHQI